MTDRTFVLFLRGINVGGRNPLRMAALVDTLEGLGARDVKTYVQSGNAVFHGPATVGRNVSRKLAQEIGRTHGFEPEVFVMGLDVVDEAMKNNPFPEVVDDPKNLHVGFLVSKPGNPDLDTLKSIRKPTERYRLVGTTFYLHAPEGVARSKLATRAEKLLGVTMTVRNWRTVCKVRDLAAGQGGT